MAESYGNRLTAFDIDADGACRTGDVWADLGDGIPTGSASMPTARSGTPMSPTSVACASAKAARCCRRSTLDRGCFACMLGGPDRRTLFIATNEWRGPESMAGARDGQVLAVEAPASGVGWP